MSASTFYQQRLPSSSLTTTKMRCYEMLIRTIFFLCVLHFSYAVTCEPGTFLKDGSCLRCPPGTYQDSSNRTSCDKCPAGEFNNIRGASDFSFCRQCAPGTSSNSGAADCTKCPRGRYSRLGYSKCLSCPPGRALAPYDESCQKCPPAFYRPADAPATTCMFCPSGMGSFAGATKCFKCPKGTFRDRQFITPGGRDSILGCAACPKNTFADVTGSVQCKLCPLGSIAEERGAIQCTSCPPGTFRGRIRKRECTPCPEGTNSKGKTPAGCMHPEKGCPVNTFEDSDGECRACMPGERLDVMKKKCVPCGPREISLGGVATECKTCPLGQRPANSNTIFEKSRCECEDGAVPLGTTGCRKCPAGTHWSNRPAGAIWYVFRRISYYRSARCDLCQKGFFSDKPGMTKCTICPPGTYTNVEGSKSCTPCPVGFISKAGDPLEELDEYSGLRATCVSNRTGCSIGEKFDRTRGYCRSNSCPPNTRLLDYSCGQCWFDEYYDKETMSCKDCPEEQSNPRGIFPRCRFCPKGAISDYTGECVCTGKFGDDGKGACKLCRSGEVSTAGRCERCGEDSWFRIKNGVPECKRCTGNTIKLREGLRRCNKCRAGFKKARDLFGREVNACVPRDLYPIS